MRAHDPVFKHQRLVSLETSCAVELPNGCRDVIGRLEPDGRMTCVPDRLAGHCLQDE